MRTDIAAIRGGSQSQGEERCRACEGMAGQARRAFWRCLGLSLPAMILMAGCGGTHTVVSNNSVTPTTVSTADGISVSSPTVADAAALKTAVMSSIPTPTTCPPAVVPNSVRIATVAVSGVAWAIAQFQPGPGCTVVGAPLAGSTTPQTMDPFSLEIYDSQSNPPEIVFQRPPNGQWTMNWYGGYPFPCPDPGGKVPGPGVGALPPPVLSAWHLSYAQGCAELRYPSAGH